MKDTNLWTLISIVWSNDNSLENISNTAPMISVKWHQKDPFFCVVYSHCTTNDSYNICIHGCCLLYNYVIKPFGILQRVIKNQRVLILITFEHNKGVLQALI